MVLRPVPVHRYNGCSLFYGTGTLGKVIRIRGYSANGTQERHSRIRIRIRASFVPHS